MKKDLLTIPGQLLTHLPAFSLLLTDSREDDTETPTEPAPEINRRNI